MANYLYDTSGRFIGKILNSEEHRMRSNRSGGGCAIVILIILAILSIMPSGIIALPLFLILNLIFKIKKKLNFAIYISIFSAGIFILPFFFSNWRHFYNARNNEVLAVGFYVAGLISYLILNRIVEKVVLNEDQKKRITRNKIIVLITTIGLFSYQQFLYFSTLNAVKGNKYQLGNFYFIFHEEGNFETNCWGFRESTDGYPFQIDKMVNGKWKVSFFGNIILTPEPLDLNDNKEYKKYGSENGKITLKSLAELQSEIIVFKRKKLYPVYSYKDITIDFPEFKKDEHCKSCNNMDGFQIANPQNNQDKTCQKLIQGEWKVKNSICSKLTKKEMQKLSDIHMLFQKDSVYSKANSTVEFAEGDRYIISNGKIIYTNDGKEMLLNFLNDNSFELIIQVESIGELKQIYQRKK
jgi:hypothetical protein